MQNQRLSQDKQGGWQSGLNQLGFGKCPICCWSFTPDELFSIDHCGHLFCEACLMQHVEHQTQNMLIPVCPEYQCGASIDFKGRFYQKLPLALHKKTQKVLNYRKILNDSTLKPCLSPDCAGVVDTKVGMTCGQCGKEHCSVCFGLKHGGECEVRIAVGLEMRRKWRQCSACGQVIQKTQGCTHMQCPCGNYFCYSCGQTLHGQHECMPPVRLTGMQTVRWQVQHLQLWYQRNNCTFLRLLLCLSPPEQCNACLRVLWVVLFTLVLYPLLVVLAVVLALAVAVLLVGLAVGFSLLIPFIALCSGNLHLFPNYCIVQSCGCCIAFLLVLIFYPVFYVINMVQFLYTVLVGDQTLPPVDRPFLQLCAGVRYVVLMPCLMLVSNEQYYLNSASLREKNQIVMGGEII